MISDLLAEVVARAAAAAVRSGRDPDDVTLVAVSKGQPTEAIRAAYDAGHRDFGENRAQELAAKAPLLPDDIRWHFIGSLQRRKVRLVRPIASLLHSLDRVSLANTWAHVEDSSPVPPVLLQVNLAREPQKGGVAPGGAAELMEHAVALGIDVAGLMVIPPVSSVAEDSRTWFDALVALRNDLTSAQAGLQILSMGMTDDYEVAVEAGSTMIRVGRAIFGPRPTG